MFERWDSFLRTFASLSGQSVFDLETASEIGKVIDLSLDVASQKVNGLVIDQKGWFNQHLLLPIEKVRQFGTDGIVISSKNVLMPLNKKSLSLNEGKARLKGKLLLSTEGEKLGLVEDVYFQEEMGKIIGYEVTEGLLAEMKEGKKIVKTNAPLIVGEEVLMIEI